MITQQIFLDLLNKVGNQIKNKCSNLFGIGSLRSYENLPHYFYPSKKDKIRTKAIEGAPTDLLEYPFGHYKT